MHKNVHKFSKIILNINRRSHVDLFKIKSIILYIGFYKIVIFKSNF